ncbi:MAG: hypothetical protein ACKO5X_08500, partial [Limnohabitans sp.]
LMSVSISVSLPSSLFSPGQRWPPPHRRLRPRASLCAAFIVVLPIFLNQFLPVLAAWLGMAMSTTVVSHAELMIFGALIVWFLIVEPHGLARLWAIGKQKMRVWPFPY